DRRGEPLRARPCRLLAWPEQRAVGDRSTHALLDRGLPRADRGRGGPGWAARPAGPPPAGRPAGGGRRGAGPGARPGGRPPAPAGVIVGGIGGGMLEAETWHWRVCREGVDDPRLRRAIRSVLPSAHAETLARRYGATGPKQTVVLACSSGGAALGLAADLVRSGETPLALAGGVDALTPVCFLGVNAVKRLDSEPCRPFARDRRGMSLGEAPASSSWRTPPMPPRGAQSPGPPWPAPGSPPTRTT